MAIAKACLALCNGDPELGKEVMSFSLGQLRMYIEPSYLLTFSGASSSVAVCQL